MLHRGVYSILTDLVSGFTTRQRPVVGAVIGAYYLAATARTLGVATALARSTGVQLDSALNRIYRLLRNPHLSDESLARSPIRATARDGRLLVAVDWTEWHSGMRILAAATVTGRRAIPIFARAFSQSVERRSQNTRENNFIRTLAMLAHEQSVAMTVVCDRGFRRVSLLRLLEQHQLSFVVRLMSDVMVQHQGRSVALTDIAMPRGRIMDLGVVELRREDPMRVRVIGYWAHKAKEPWWIATNVEASPSHVLSLYDRRMTVEECFRDSKGARFGARLGWTRHRDAAKLARSMLLVAFAMLLWTVTGLAAADHDKSLRLVSASKGPRQSWLTIGLRYAVLGQGLPLDDLRLERLPPPELRRIAGSRRGGK